MLALWFTARHLHDFVVVPYAHVVIIQFSFLRWQELCEGLARDFVSRGAVLGSVTAAE